MNPKSANYAIAAFLAIGALCSSQPAEAKKKKKTELPKTELSQEAKDSVAFHKKVERGTDGIIILHDTRRLRKSDEKIVVIAREAYQPGRHHLTGNPVIGL